MLTYPSCKIHFLIVEFVEWFEKSENEDIKRFMNSLNFGEVDIFSKFKILIFELPYSILYHNEQKDEIGQIALLIMNETDDDNDYTNVLNRINNDVKTRIFQEFNGLNYVDDPKDEYQKIRDMGVLLCQAMNEANKKNVTLNETMDEHDGKFDEIIEETQQETQKEN